MHRSPGFNRTLMVSVTSLWFVYVFIIQFSGSAVAQSVEVSWNPNPDQSVAGYNIYRTEHSGVYDSEPLNGNALLRSTSFTDATVHFDRTYYYAVAAVNVGGIEGELSDEIRIVVDPEATGRVRFAPTTSLPQLLQRMSSDPGVASGVFPWFPIGGGAIEGLNVIDGFETALVVQNKNDAPSWFQVSTFDQSGNFLIAGKRFTGGAGEWELTDSGSHSLPTAGAAELRFGISSPHVRAGMMLFETSRGPDGTPDVEPFLVYRLKRDGDTVTETFGELGFPETCARFYAQRHGGQGLEVFESAVAMANPNIGEASVTLTLRDDAGAFVESQTFLIPPGHNLGEMLANVFKSGWADGTGSLEVTSDIGVVVVAFNLSIRTNGAYTFFTVPKSRCVQ